MKKDGNEMMFFSEHTINITPEKTKTRADIENLFRWISEHIEEKLDYLPQEDNDYFPERRKYKWQRKSYKECSEEERLHKIAQKIYDTIIFREGRGRNNKLFYLLEGMYPEDIEIADEYYMDRRKRDFYKFVDRHSSLQQNIVDICIDFQIYAEVLRAFIEDEWPRDYLNGGYPRDGIERFFVMQIIPSPYNFHFKFDILKKELYPYSDERNKIRFLTWRR